MRVAIAVAAVVLVMAGSACTTGGSASPTPGTSPLDEAIARTERARSGRFVVSIDAPGERSVSVRATGAFDRDLGVFTVVTDLSEFAPDLGGAVTLVADQSGLFVDCPSLARQLGVSTRWIGVRGEAAVAVQSSVVDPWRVLDLARRAAATPGGGGGVVVGDDGFVNRASVRFDAVATGGPASLSVEFFDLGLPVEIGSPAPDETTDETDALNRLFGGPTGG